METQTATIAARIESPPATGGHIDMQNMFTNACKALRVPANSKIKRKEKVDGFISEDVFDLTSNYVGSLGFQALILPLSENPRLRAVIVPSNGLTNEVVTFFCRAFSHHSSLSYIDFSGNPISLPAALALVQLVHVNPTITEIVLKGTCIDEIALRRIRRSLNIRKAAAQKAAPASPGAQPTPYRKVVADFEQKRGGRRLAMLNAARNAEAAAPGNLAQWIAAKKILRPLRADAGWAIVNVLISTTPTDFVSELHAIHRIIVPKLNAKFASNRVWVHPVSMFVDDASGYQSSTATTARAASLGQKHACRGDHASAIGKSGPLFVHLFGEKIGLMQYTPLSVSEGSGRPAARPIQEVDYEEACATGGCNIVMIRNGVLKMNIPAGLIALMTDNPHLAHPDPNFPLVRTAIAEARGVSHPLSSFDIDLEREKWRRHSQFVERVARTHTPSSAIVKPYEATFNEVDAAGNVRLKNLEGFCEALGARLEAAIEQLFSPRPKADELMVNENRLAARGAFYECAPDTLHGRKNLLGKLDVYAVTPPSRNTTLICAPPGGGNTAALSSFVHRSLRRGGYRIAFHFCRNPHLCEEPSDPRSMFLSLIEQLLPDGKLPSFIKAELDVIKIKQYFSETLTTTVADAGEKIIILVIDGIEDIDPYVLPCTSLRIGDTGIDVWSPPPPARSTLVPRKPDSARTITPFRASSVDDFDWIPVCLQRTLRIVASTVANSPAQLKLSIRGHDSCDPIFVDDMQDSDVDAYLTDAAKTRLGIQLTDAELNIIREKIDAHNPQYLQYVLHVLQGREELPSYFSRSALLEQVPQTLPECCAATIRIMENEFGTAVARNVLCLLVLSRWGLYETELRMLLQAAFGHKPNHQPPDSEYVNYATLQHMLRRLRPWLLASTKGTTNGAGQAAAVPASGFDNLVFISSRIFCAAISEKYLDDDENYVRRIHTQLAHHYRRLSFTESHALQSRAVKRVAHHVIAASMWDVFASAIVTLDYVSLVFRFAHAYSVVRELILGYNILDDTRTALMTVVSVQPLKLKLREYIFFMKDHNTNLAQYPHMAHQIAVTYPQDTLICNDAKEHFKSQQPHFAVVNRLKVKLHRDRITSCQFAPSGLRIASCSDDRGVRICNLYGETLLSINQSAAKTKLLKYSPTSRYLSVIAEDHCLMVFDASSGSLVSRALDAHSAPVRAICMSARGRFVITGGEDRVMKMFESETGQLVAVASHTPYSHPTSAFAGVGAVASHPIEEDTCYSMCDRNLIRWKLSHARDSLEQTLLIQGHASSPMASFHILCDGSFAVTCARDLPVVQAAKSGEVRTEDNVKVWSLASGRLVASMTLGSNAQTFGPVFSAVSPNERVVATAILDGSIDLHELDCRSYAPEAGEPIIVTPYRHFIAFASSPTPKVSMLCFSFDSTLICAGGNERHIKVWSAATYDEDTTNEAKSPRSCSIAEYLMDQPLMCMDWTPNRTEDGGELIAGDTVGRLHVLRLIL